jgi:phage gpG-like protein
VIDLTIDTGPAAADITRWASHLARDVSPALGQHAGRVAGRTKSSLPRRTGRLAGSVRVDAGQEGARVVMSAPYARFAEYGGRGFPRSAHGNYLGPAAIGLEPQLAATAALATDVSIRSYPWSR